MREFNYLWLIPFFPLLGAVVIRFFGKRWIPRRGVHFIACSMVVLSFLVTLVAFFKLRGLGDAASQGLTNGLFPWISIGTGSETFEVWVRFLLDPLSSTMALFVTGIGGLIHIYSTGYMSKEEDYERYFAYLNLFMAMMLILVLADSLLLMFVGWEGVGLCSYLLIGFWFTDHANANAGKKAFIVNRIGDFGFIIGMMILFWTLYLSKGIWSLDYAVLRENAGVFAGPMIFGVSAIVLATLMLFIGAMGKSAQIPLYVWLPDAMAGPTPVSALIHAATMVTAGVYMVARLSFLFDLAPFTLNVIMVIGALTAFVSATIGLAQNDIKKVLAYSTVSQLGYMFLACGVGAYVAGINHVLTHAFFKALLFLGAGSVIHAMHHEQDMRKMGGLRKKIPITFWTFTIGTIAIAGFPPFAGFFSKDEILWQAYSSHHYIAWGAGLSAAFLTSFYMFRLYYLTFFGECRADEETQKHIHESPKTMTIPLMILAFFSVIGGIFYLPAWITHHPILPEWMKGVVVYNAHEGDHMLLEITLALVSVGVATAGFFLARAFYLKETFSAAKVAMRWAPLHRWIYGKYFVDEAYERVFVNGAKKTAAISSWFDRYIIDAAVHLVAWIVRMTTFIHGTFDRIFVDGLVNLSGKVTMSLGQKVRSMQTGQVQMYVGTVAGVLVVLSFLWMSFLG